jgi:hypothetical protein
MTSRRVWTAVAVLCVFAQVVAGFLLGDSRFKWLGIIALVVALPFPIVVLAMRVRGRVALVAFFVGLGVLMASGTTANPLWLSLFGETAECEILAQREERTSKYGKETHYDLRCGDRRRDSVVLSSHETKVGDVGDRTTVVFDRYDVVAAGRPGELKKTGLWLLPSALLAALAFVAYAATRPVEPDPPRRSAKRRRPEEQPFL